MRTISKYITAAALSITCGVANAIWDTPSVWQKMAHYGSTVEGTVKTVAHDAVADRYLVRIKTKNSTETFNICYEHIQSANKQSDASFTSKNPHLQMLTDAMDEGKKVKLTYGGIWNKCITSIELEKADAPSSVESAGDVEAGFVEI